MSEFGSSWILAWEAHRDIYTRDACLHWIIEDATACNNHEWANEAQSALDTGDNEDFDAFIRWCDMEGLTS